MKLLAAVLLLAILSACTEDTPAPTAAPIDAKVERGRYLVDHVSQCGFCHTQILPDNSRDITILLAGQLFADLNPSDPNVGALYTANLTPDGTGLAQYT